MVFNMAVGRGKWREGGREGGREGEKMRKKSNTTQIIWI